MLDYININLKLLINTDSFNLLNVIFWKVLKTFVLLNFHTNNLKIYTECI